MNKLLQYIILITLFQSVALAQNVDIKGSIKDALGNPAIDALVQIKGTENATLVDSTGNFNLSAEPKWPISLVIKYDGFNETTFDIRDSASLGKRPLEIVLIPEHNIDDVVITSRRRDEVAQDVPIPISVIGGTKADEAGAFNVNRLKELVPTVQLYASNPRNTTLNIRGLGSTFGLTNDGIDPGVGFYVDGVYYARPAATALDFVDIEQIEVLRGPQGTLFGKNTTAGAFNITTKKPSFKTGGKFELSGGNYGFVQAKGSITGRVAKKLAARVSFSGTHRDGTIENVRSGVNVNSLSNQGLKGQLLYAPSEHTQILLSADYTQQNPIGYAQVYAGYVTTKRASYRQFPNIIKDLNYQVVSENPFDRKVDHDTPSKAGNNFGGISLNADFKIGKGTLTSTTAWRNWIWKPLNDRDYIGLPSFTISAGNSIHDQYSQELRYAGNISSKLSGVIGAFALFQDLKSDPVQTEEAGSAQWRFAKSDTSKLWATPGLLDNFGIKTTNRIRSTSAAVFGQLDWAVTKRFHVLPGLRFNYDRKIANYKRETYGGLQTTDAALLKIKNAVYTNQAFDADVSENNLSGQITLQYKTSQAFNSFATFSTSYKPVGVNIGGLPTASGAILTDLAEVKPEFVVHYEAGIKTKPTKNSILNLVIHNTDIKDYQTQVQTPEPGVNRGYLANAEKVRVFGAELDGSIRIGNHFSINTAVAYTDAKYVSFKNAPVPLEEVGGSQSFKDVSGGDLPGVSKWSGSLGAEVSTKGKFFGFGGSYFLGVDAYYRSKFSSSPSPSKYLNIDGYSLLNGRLGFRGANGFSVYIWGRNVLNKDYFEQLLPAPGSAGHYGAVLGDPRTYGITLKQTF
jgi:iron complex outermembrane recepter protein